MNLLLDLKALMAKRGEHLAAIEEIDRTLADVRKAMGVPVDAPVIFPDPTPRKRARGVPMADGWTRNRILEVLAEREPLTTRELSEKIPEVKTVAQHLAALYTTGRVVRIKHNGSRRAFIYARSVDAFAAAEAEAVEADTAEAV